MMILVFNKLESKINFTITNFSLHKANHMKIRRNSSIVKILVVSLSFSFILAAIIPSMNNLVDIQRYIYSFYFRYPSLNYSFIELLETGTEIGFLFLNKIVSRLTNNYFWILFIIYFFSMSVTLQSARKLTRSKLLFLLLFSSMYFVQGTYLLKQTIAVAFSSIAFNFLVDGKKLKYLFWVIISSLFHITALVMLPAYFIIKGNKSNKYYAILASFILFVFFGYDYIMPFIFSNIPNLERYLTISESTFISEGNLLTIFKGIPFYILSFYGLFLRSKIKLNYKYADIFIISSIFYSLSWLFSYKIYWFFRLGWYFLLPTLVLFILVINVIKFRENKLLAFSIIFFPMLVLTLRQIIIIFII
jgi:hypothetical protein